MPHPLTRWYSLDGLWIHRLAYFRSIVWCFVWIGATIQIVTMTIFPASWSFRIQFSSFVAMRFDTSSQRLTPFFFEIYNFYIKRKVIVRYLRDNESMNSPVEIASEFHWSIVSYVYCPEDIDSFFGQFTFPNFGMITNPEIWIIAFTIALVASLETLLCVVSILGFRKRVLDAICWMGK